MWTASGGQAYFILSSSRDNAKGVDGKAGKDELNTSEAYSEPSNDNLQAITGQGLLKVRVRTPTVCWGKVRGRLYHHKK